MMAWFFIVTMKWLYFKHGNWCMTEKWLPCNDMHNINMVIASDYEMIGIRKTNQKLITKWLMYNDMGNINHLPIIYI
jgi:hypothetical protein